MLMRQNWATGSCSPRSRPWLTETKPPPIITWPGSSPAIPLRRKALCNERFRPCWLAGRSGRRSRPRASAPDEIPMGTPPADQAVAGYAMAVNLVSQAAELDCDAGWRRRQRIYAAEIARLESGGGTADSAVVDTLNTERVRAALNARYCEELHTIAQAGYERIFELMGPHDVGSSRTEIL